MLSIFSSNYKNIETELNSVWIIHTDNGIEGVVL
jgi:hypothetical protein